MHTWRMESTIVGALLVIVGAVTLVRNLLMLRDPTKIVAYVETSPKAALWRNKLGIERTVELSKRYFLPLGSLVSVGLIAVGVAMIVGLVRG